MADTKKLSIILKYKILASIMVFGLLGSLFVVFSREEGSSRNLQSAIITENVEIINVGGSTPTTELLNTPDFSTGGITLSGTATKGFARQFTLNKQTTLKEAQFYAYGNISGANPNTSDGSWPMWLTVVIYKDNAVTDSYPDKSSTGEVCVMRRVPYTLIAGKHSWQQLNLTSYNCILEPGTYWLAFENRSPVAGLSNENDMTSGTKFLQAPSVNPVVWKNAKLSATNTTGLYETDGTRGRFMRLLGTTTTITSRTLTINKTGDGSGTITSNPTGITCTDSACTKTYNDTTEDVVLTATPSANSTITWTGCDTTSDKTCTINMGGGNKTVTATFTTIPPQPEMIAHYSFDNTHVDSTGNNNDGTIVGATYNTTTKKIGTHAIEFNGTNSYSTAGTGTNINAIKDGVSISTWIYRPTNASNMGVIAQRTKLNTYLEYFLLFIDGNNKINWLVNPSGGPTSHTIITAPTALSNNTWYHIVATYNGNSMKLYVDNILVQSADKTGIFVDDTTPLLFGAGRGDSVSVNNYTEFYKGLLDETSVYNYALNTDEINTLYAAGGSNPPVNTAPSAPNLTTATAGNAQVILTWTAPVSNGGSPITNYILEYKKVSDTTCTVFSDIIAPDATSITVSPLNNNEAYMFRIYAKNAIGESVASNEKTTTPTGGVTSHTVTATAGANGTISPGTRSVAHGGTTTFTVTPNAGYTAVVTGTCGGTLSGTTYTTNAITAACTVIATFTQITHTVTATAGANGSITAPTTKQVAQGATTTFTVTPSAGYSAVVTGTCGGTLSGTTYTTNAITAACTVIATFTQTDNTPPTTPSRPVGVPQTGVIISGDGATITVSANVVSLGLKVNCAIGETIKLYNGASVSAFAGQTCTTNPQTINFNPSSFQNIFSVSATLTDTSNNESFRSAFVSIIKEVTNNPAPSTPNLLDTSDTGAYTDDNLTNNSKPQFSITGCVSGNTVILLADNIPVGNGACIANTAFITPTDALLDGEYLMTAKQTNPNTNITSSMSDVIKISIDTSIPLQPTSLTSLNITQTSTNISWTAPTDSSDIIGYVVYRNSAQINTTTKTSYTDSDLIAGTIYRYIIYTKDTAGNLSNPSERISITTLSRTTSSTSGGGGGGGGGGSSNPIQGLCNPSLKTFSTPTPSKTSLKDKKLCKTGTATTVTYDSSKLEWYYSCRGSNNGSSDTCTVSAQINAAPVSAETCDLKPVKALPFTSCKLNSNSFINYHRYLSCLTIVTSKKTCAEAGCEKNALRQNLTAMAVKIRGIPLESGYTCQKRHTDTSNEKASWVCEIADKAQIAGLISPTNKQFRPENTITRSEAFSILLKSICIHPNTTSQNWQTEVAKTAKKYGFTTRSVATFEPNKPILNQELFVLVARVAEWKAKNPNNCGALPDELLCK